MRRWLARIAVALAVLVAVLILGVLPWWLGGIATQSRFQMTDRENEGVTPGSLGLAYEDISFRSRDGVPLEGWWVPAAHPRGSVVLVHGLNRSRVEMVRKAPFLVRAGWNALPFDIRRHGTSGGERRSLGWGERLDVLGAVDQALSRSPGPIVVWGVSVGGAASLLAAAEEPKVAGLVCDSSYRSLHDTARHHLALFRKYAWWLRLAPVWPVADEAVFWMGRRGGFDPAALDIAAAARKLRGRPVLFVAGSADPRMPQEIAQDLSRAAGERATTLVVKSERHGHAYADGTESYEKAVSAVLDAVAPAGPPSAGVQGVDP